MRYIPFSILQQANNYYTLHPTSYPDMVTMGGLAVTAIFY